jgi:hypothetical protein
MVSLLYGKFQLFHRNFSLMEKLQNETAMYTRLVYIDTVGHATCIHIYVQSAQKCGSKFFDWSRKMTLFYRDLFYAWQRRYLN